MNEVSQIIKNLLAETENLQKLFEKSGKKFTLDGRLVGDIGEVLAELKYDISLHKDLRAKYDAQTPDGKNVQIKATMKNALSFPCDPAKIPDYYLGLKINNDGTLTEIFNGKGSLIAKAIEKRKATSNGLHMIDIDYLLRLNEKVDNNDIISKRNII